MFQLSVISRRLIGWVLFAACASAQTVTATLAAGTSPDAIAVNPVTNKIYVANSGSNNVTVIDGATNNTTTVATGMDPVALAVNTVTNQIYVANSSSSNVTVIDGATNTTTTVTDLNATNPVAVAVNPVTNQIYVVNKGTNNVTVINGATYSTTVSVGTNPVAVAVNPVTNKIYVVNNGSNNVTEINGANNIVTTKAVGSGPVAVAVDPIVNKTYITNYTGNTVTVIRSNNTTTSANGGGSPQTVAVNPVAGSVFWTNAGNTHISYFSATTGSGHTINNNGYTPTSLAVNPVTNQVYVTNGANDTVTVFTGTSGPPTATVADPNATSPGAVAVNPVTNKIYVANNGSNNVSVIDGATNATATVPDSNGTEPDAVAVDAATNNIYVANLSSKNVTVIAGGTNTTTTVTVGNKPQAVAVNPITDDIYVPNLGDNSVTVINGANNGTATVTDPKASGPVQVAVNPVTNKIYVANCGSYCGASGNGSITVIDGATNNTTNITDPNASGPVAIAVNPVTNRIYVANYNSNNVTVINGFTNGVTTVTDPHAINPTSVAVNPVTNKTYVANSGSDNVTVIDGATNSVTTVTDSSASVPGAVAVNPVTNKIYVANNNSNSVTVIDGATNKTTTVSDPNATTPLAIAVNLTTNKIYVANRGSGNVTVIDGVTNTILTDSIASDPVAVAVNPVTNEIYVPNQSSNNVTVIVESNVQAVPLQASITAQTNNEVTGASATFSFSASSSFSPTAPPPDGLYYQLDTWQGPWQPATSEGSNNFTGTVSGLAPGTHVLYAYSTDGQDATSTNTGQQSSPLISNITAYVFLELPPTGTPSIVSASPNAASGAAQTFVLTYSDTGGTDALQFVSVDFNSTLTAAHGCSVRYEQAYYNQAKSALYLYNDAGNAVKGPLVPGSSGTLMNSQCTINGMGSSVTTDGNNLVLNLSVTASSSFEGAKNIYMYAADNSPAITGWVNEGTWTPSPPFVPSVVSASPNPATGAAQNFVLKYADTGGYGVLTSVGALFNATLSSKSGCYVYYAPQTNLLYLQNDNGQGATSITPGSGTLTNSQCTINGNSTSVVTSGNNLTLNLAVTASGKFEGAKNIYMYAADSTSATTGWVKEGIWTPSPPFVPSIVSASPNPALGPSQNFVLEYSDTGGYAALTSVAALFNSSLSSKNACYVYYSPQTNLLYLQNDNGEGATSITPGSGTLSNSQCTITGSSTSVTTSGNNLTLNLAVMGSVTFTGVQKIYMRAADDSGASSAWVDEGTWAP